MVPKASCAGSEENRSGPLKGRSPIAQKGLPGRGRALLIRHARPFVLRKGLSVALSGGANVIHVVCRCDADGMSRQKRAPLRHHGTVGLSVAIPDLIGEKARQQRNSTAADQKKGATTSLNPRVRSRLRRPKHSQWTRASDPKEAGSANSSSSRFLAPLANRRASRARAPGLSRFSGPAPQGAPRSAPHPHR
jgi:hypothetical protein